MRNISAEIITNNIKEMCIEANHFLSPDMKRVFEKAADEETSALGKQILGQLRENLEIAGADDSDMPGYRNGCCIYEGRTGCAY
jgi:fumarate hydratase subunit alpha